MNHFLNSRILAGLASLAFTPVPAFVAVTPTLTVQRAGTGFGAIQSVGDGNAIECGDRCIAEYAEGTIVILDALPMRDPMGRPSTFIGWSGGGCTGMRDCVVTMDSAKFVTATFIADAVEVTLDKSGRGAITSDPPGLLCDTTCAAATGYFTRGIPVSLVATPETGWQMKWTVDGAARFPADPNRLPLDLVAGTGDYLDAPPPSGAAIYRVQRVGAP